MSAINNDDLREGMRIRWIRGHHPGMLSEIVRLNDSDALILGISGGGSANGQQTWIPRAHIVANAAIARISKAERRRLARLVQAQPKPQGLEALEYFTSAPKEQEPTMSSPRRTTEELRTAMLANDLRAEDLSRAVSRLGMNVTAKRLGISDTQLSRMMTQWGIATPGRGQKASGGTLDSALEAKLRPLVFADKVTGTAPTPQRNPMSVPTTREATGVTAVLRQARAEYAKLGAREDEIRAELASVLQQRTLLARTIQTLEQGLPKEDFEAQAREA